MKEVLEFDGGAFERARVKAKLSRRELAYALGCTPEAIYYWERGQRKPGFDLIMNAARVLHVPVEDFCKVVVNEGQDN